MRQLLYRLSWDKEYKRKFLIISFSSLSFVVLCLIFVPFGVQMYSNIQRDNVVNTDEVEEGAKYDISFKDDAFQNEENSENDNSYQNKTSNNLDTNQSQEHHPSPYNPGSGDVPISHTHSWHVVIDSYPWDEVVYIQTGTKYICRNCGFVCYDLNTAESHSSLYGHGYKTEAIMETRTIHHDGTSHEECCCGARK